MLYRDTVRIGSIGSMCCMAHVKSGSMGAIKAIDFESFLLNKSLNLFHCKMAKETLKLMIELYNEVPAWNPSI